LQAKGLNENDIHKEILPVYGGKGLSRKAVHNWVENHVKHLANDEGKWLRQQPKTSILRVSTHW
jgi:hypothetical protein